MPTFRLSRRTLLRCVAGTVLLAGCESAGNSGKNKETHMAEVLLLHHAQGLTDGVKAFADQLRQAGHTVHTPDTYQGKVFETLDEGIAYAQETGFGEVRQRGLAAAESLPAELVYIGISLGVMAAQQLAQTRPGARGAVLLESCVPSSEFGAGWPKGVPVQVHGMDADPFFAGEGDIDAARALVKEAEDGELFVYPGDRHLFTDGSLATYDAEAAGLVVKRVLDFLARI
jgi:dienelactone hydrolase